MVVSVPVSDRDNSSDERNSYTMCVVITSFVFYCLQDEELYQTVSQCCVHVYIVYM